MDDDIALISGEVVTDYDDGMPYDIYTMGISTLAWGSSIQVIFQEYSDTGIYDYANFYYNFLRDWKIDEIYMVNS